MENFLDLSRDAQSLLLYLEDCLVNQRGKCEAVRMNRTDFNLAEQWEKQGRVKLIRLPAREAFGPQRNGKAYTHQIMLFSDEAWALVQMARRDRAKRNAPPDAQV